MNRILQSVLLIALLSVKVFGQCAAIQQTVSTSTTTSVCLDGSTSYIVTIDGSEIGLEYVLIDTLDGSVIAGPIAGTGNPIDFNTGNLSRTTTFEVLAQTPPTPGNALRFGGGQNDFASYFNAWNFDYTQGYTLEFVFNGNTDPQNFFNSLFSIGGDFIDGNARVDDLEVYFQQATNTLVVVHDRGQANLQFSQYTSPASFTDVHIAMVFDPSLPNDQGKFKVYYDGVQQQNLNTSSPITTMTKTTGANWYVGDIRHQDFSNITDVCNGTFDEVRVWNHGRSEAQINANKASCVSSSEQGLAHYWKFDEGNGSVTADATANGHNMDIINTSTNIFWVPELISCGSDCQVPMANTVTIGDLDAPTLSLSSSVRPLDLDPTGNVIVNLADLVTAAADNCSDSSALVFTADVISFTCSDLGINTIFVTVTDESGNGATSGTVVNVRDVTAPTITLNSSTPLEFELDAITNEVILGITELNSVVQDNCDSNPTVSLSKTTFTCTDLGIQTITVTATDGEGNQSTASEDVVIVDRTLPTFTVLNPTLELDENGTYTIQQSDIVTNLADNCSTVNDITVSFDDPLLTCSKVGNSFDFDFIVVDANGNVANGTSRIAVVDLIVPVVVTKDLTVELDQSGSITIDPSQVDDGTSDNCSFTLSLDKKTFTTADLGTNSVTLTATDAGGNTSSATATVTVEAPRTTQTITFPQPEDAVYGDGPVALNATASSGLPVTYTVTFGPGRIINGNEVEILGAGDVNIEAIQAGDDAFTPATSSVVLKAIRATLTATAEDVTITYNSNDLISFSITYSGFVNGDDALSLDQVPTAGSTATVASDAGTYDIVVTGGSDNNYDYNYVNGVFTIEKADQVINFPSLVDVDLALNSSLFLSASSDAGLPIQYTITEGGDIATLADTEITLSDIGLVTVEAAQTGTNNYNAALSVSQSFQVTDSRKSDQTITFSAIGAQEYGNQVTLDATASSNLQVTYLLTQGIGSIANGILTIEGVGAYEVIAKQGGDVSFNPASDVAQQFVVAKSMITATAENKTIAEGQGLPDFTIVYSGFKLSDDTSVLDEVPVTSTTATSQSEEGTYPITLIGGVDDTYDFDLIDGILTIERVLGLTETQIIIYPNPAQDYLIIESTEQLQIEVITLGGKQLLRANSTDRIDLKSLSNGVHLLRMTNDKSESKTIRFVKKD